MEWIVIISCVQSHTWVGIFYCSVMKNIEPLYGQPTKTDCERVARDYLTDKYHIHNGEFEWGFRCEERLTLAPYEPRRLER